MKILRAKQKIRKSELGAGFVEMALLIALIGVVSIAGAQTFGQQVSQKFTDNTESFNDAFSPNNTDPACGGRGQPQCSGG